MVDCLDIFGNYLINEKKASENTVESYLRDIHQFLSYCSSLNVNNIADVDKKICLDYFDTLTKIGKSEATKSRILASLRAYFRCLNNSGKISFNPTDDIKLKKAPRKLPGILDAKEILSLLDSPDIKDLKGIRDKAMLELLYATGIKVSELICLKVSDVNLQIGIVHLKNDKKERIIPIYPAAVKSISDYLSNVRPVLVMESDEDLLFTNMSGQGMSRQGFWKIIKHYAEIAGIDGDITPHTLRHSFAAHLLENGAKLTDIKDMLGHSDISSTHIYADIIKSKYSTVYSKYHPLAK